MDENVKHTIGFHMSLLCDAFRYLAIAEKEGVDSIEGADEVIFDIADQLRAVLKIVRHTEQNKDHKWNALALGLIWDAASFTPHERWTRPMVEALRIAWQTWNISGAGNLPNNSKPPIELSALRITLKNVGWVVVSETEEETA